MSCYNASRYLREAMDSVSTQTYRDYEFIVVNDGSTDDTAKISQEYAAKDDRIALINKENTGLADSLNTGMRIARGEWIARLDADDIALPDRLARQMAYVDSHPQTVLVGSGFIEMDPVGTCLRHYRYPARQDRCRRRIERIGSFPPHSSCCYHKPTVERLGGFNGRFRRSQDADLWFRLSRVGEIGVLSTPLVKIRKHRENISNEDGGRMQATFGIAAHVCHLLRVQGTDDPSAQDDDVWSEFLEWLAGRVAQYGLFEQKREWTRLKGIYFSSPNRTIGACRLLKGLATSPHAMQIVRKKCFGSDLAATLAHEWRARLCAASLE